MSPLLLLLAFTDPVEFDADDPAFAICESDPTRSLILGTDKEKSPGGGIYAFSLSGKTVAKVKGLDRPNNIDVFQAFQIEGRPTQLAIATERLQSRLRVFRVEFEPPALIDITGKTDVFRDASGEDRAPMGVACWNWQGRNFAFVTPKAGAISKHLEQVELIYNPISRRVDSKLVRKFGWFSGKKETESIAVDAGTNRVYYSDEGNGIWVYDARPDAPDRPIMLIRNPLHVGDHEGLAILDDLLVSSDQRKDINHFWFYDKRSGIPRGGFKTVIDETDGIDICPPLGLMAAMNSKGKNFALLPLDWVRQQVGRYP